MKKVGDSKKGIKERLFKVPSWQVVALLRTSFYKTWCFLRQLGESKYTSKRLPLVTILSPPNKPLKLQSRLCTKPPFLRRLFGYSAEGVFPAKML